MRCRTSSAPASTQDLPCRSPRCAPPSRRPSAARSSPPSRRSTRSQSAAPRSRSCTARRCATGAPPPAAFSGPRVLTMEFLDGFPIDDLARIAELGVDPRPLIEQTVRGWFLTAIRYGVFHGDVHAGNLMLLRDGRIAALDWGIVGQLDPKTHRFFRRAIEAALGDEAAWDEVPE